MKTLLLKNWNIMRLLRLAIGIWALIAAFQSKEFLVALMGGALIVMAIMNVGCCGAGGCNTYSKTNKKTSEIPKEVTYEEIS